MHNCLVPDLCDIYSTCTTNKELWNSLNKKYATKDARSKKFVVDRLLNFKVNDKKSLQLLKLRNYILLSMMY